MSETAVTTARRRQDDRPRRSWVLIILLAVSGVLGVVVGGVELGADLTRKPTANEIEAAGRKEMALRWRALKAGEIFPARVNATESGGAIRESTTATALRVGIAPGVSCSEGFDRPLAKVLVEHGCRTVLRATYVDSSGTLLTTLGVAVMPDAGRASDAETDFHTSLSVDQNEGRYGVRAVSFPGTVAEGFGDSLRQDFSYEANGTPYLFFRSSGWMTDRATPVRPVVTDTFAFAETTLDELLLRFTETTAPCERRGVRC